jgi:hypothetical protein
MDFLARLYARRIVNVNINIVLAGLLSLPLTVLVVHLSKYIGVEDHHTFALKVITLAADIIFDIMIYYPLHWVANHMPGRSAAWLHPEFAKVSFVRDATIVQFQRAALSPILYSVALGLQYVLMQDGIGRESATAIGLIAGIFSTRALHTFWMLRAERQARRRSEAAGTTERAAVQGRV